MSKKKELWTHTVDETYDTDLPVFVYELQDNFKSVRIAQVSSTEVANRILMAPDLLLALQKMVDAFDVGQDATPTSAIEFARHVLEDVRESNGHE